MTGGIDGEVKVDKVGENTVITISDCTKVSSRILVFLVMVSTNI